MKTLFIEPDSPWENGYNESFNGKLRDELLAREIFYTLPEAQVLIERWRITYNTVRPHSALGYRATGAGRGGTGSCPVRLRYAPPDWTGAAGRCLLANIVSGVPRGGRSVAPPYRGRRLAATR